MPNMNAKKTPMPEQDPHIRNRNFNEVTLGYSEQQAHAEATRCLHCQNRPCMTGCPVNVQIPAFIALVEKGDYAGAYETIKQTNSLPAVCGRVCPQE
ncbi:MAG: dihydropyrimidine dehydrogenase, partial [Hyphomonadaceae bacterium]|nr:dihydropyrimidine dehydrogenase [Clostridia bacterium]